MSLHKILVKFFFHLLCVSSFRLNNVKFGALKSANGFIRFYNQGRITIGDDFSFNSGRRFNPIGGDTVLNIVCKKSGTISIGSDVGISNSTLYAENSIVIGNGVRIGGGCKLWDTHHHSCSVIERLAVPEVKPSGVPIFLDDNVWLCASVTVLPGVTIGKNSVVAAGSVVSKSVPSDELWGGIPARKIRNI